MKVIIKLHGALRPNQSNDDVSDRVQVECAPGTKVGTLLRLLNIQDPKGYIVVMNHRTAKGEDEVIDGVALDIFRMVSGG